MNTETAQRRLIEALADMNNTPDPDIGTAATPLAAVAIGIRFGAVMASEADQPGVANIYAALADLAEAVNNDQRQEHSHG